MVAAWQVFGLAGGEERMRDMGLGLAPAATSPALAPPPAGNAAAGPRPALRSVGAQIAAATSVEAAPVGGSGSRTLVTQPAPVTAPALAALPRQRARGVGSRFAAPRPQAPAGGMR
jgi:hypothetical protein